MGTGGSGVQMGALLLSLSLSVAAGSAHAGGSAIDNDGDGRYSLEELQVFYPGLTPATFALIDTNGDGLVSPSEFRRGQDNGHLVEAVAREG
ncbi:MAG: EF-hand domain-containing protein [Rhodobacteraceae bacterium]|nr:EF-hand domain-containing protein [Paracoccaceae bacterium]